MVLRRKGGGLPPNYQEVHYWLGRVVTPAKEPVAVQAKKPALKTEAAAAPAAAWKPGEGTPEARAAEKKMPESTGLEEKPPEAETGGEPAVEAKAAEEVSEAATAAAPAEALELVEETPAVETAAAEPVTVVEEAVKPEEPAVAIAEEPAVKKAEEGAREAAEGRQATEERELPRRSGTMLGLDLDGELPKQITEEEAQAKADEDAGSSKRKRRGFLGIGRRKR
ncbi:MAG TPA: hypothetical protein VFU68_02755 [Terracidiphilus sp.]|nr:hypothetical protein [Terracidiphilus sp.]